MLSGASFDTVIVGAGIMGTALARECARSGLRTAVVESGTPGGGITSAGMGHLVVMDDSPAQLALTAYSRGLWFAELGGLPEDIELERTGTIWVAAGDTEMDVVRAKHRTYAAAGIVTEVLDSGALADSEPNLRAGLAGGLLVPEDGVMRPPAAARFCLQEAQRLGATLIAGRAVSACDGEVRLADGTLLLAPAIVLAVGNACDLLPALPLRKRKGQLLMTERAPRFARHQLVELGYLQSAHTLTSDSVAFNIQPRRSGHMVVGSSRQFGSDDPAVDEPMLRRMLDRAVSYMPALAGLATLSTWTGFRAASPDKLPLLGPALGLSDDPTLWLTVGFEGLGTTSAPGAARLLVDALLGRPSAIDRTPFLPARLAPSPQIDSPAPQETTA